MFLLEGSEFNQMPLAVIVSLTGPETKEIPTFRTELLSHLILVQSSGSADGNKTLFSLASGKNWKQLSKISFLHSNLLSLPMQMCMYLRPLSFCDPARNSPTSCNFHLQFALVHFLKSANLPFFLKIWILSNLLINHRSMVIPLYSSQIVTSSPFPIYKSCSFVHLFNKYSLTTIHHALFQILSM